MFHRQNGCDIDLSKAEQIAEKLLREVIKKIGSYFYLDAFWDGGEGALWYSVCHCSINICSYIYIYILTWGT